MADEILTGEGVALQVSAASVLVRALAWLIDAVVVVVVLVVTPLTILAIIGVDRLDQALATAIMLAIVFFAFIVVPVTVETLSHGRSLGKLALGLQVIRDDGGPVRLRHTAVRGLIGFFELWMMTGGLAFIVAMFNDRGKRVGDFLAGTYVIRVRSAPRAITGLWLPPQLAAWAQLADIRPLPAGLALRARQFLGRARQFPPAARHRLGLRLAAQLERHVAPAPPWGTYPEEFIAAVLYERRRRDQEAFDRRQPRLHAQLAGIDVLPFAVPDPES
ncbi:MAG: RDD family protein [Actinobacteria bacterium HGW-Actinobacteria-2]|nr:MAG: RDD family protein [Actinobacteria bacterium HGW-Actinobacteria-2]